MKTFACKEREQIQNPSAVKLPKCVLKRHLSEGHRDASVQLDVIRYLSELVLLLLQGLQQAVDLLLGQNNSAVVLRHNKNID